jgi:hypothetical protein
MALNDLIQEFLSGVVEEAFDQYPIRIILKNQAFIRYIGHTLYYIDQMDRPQSDQFLEDPTEEDLLFCGIEFIASKKTEREF